MPVQEIEELKEQFINGLTPLRIYLFGSFANGTYTEDSDFDFYIVVDDSMKDLKDLTTQALSLIHISEPTRPPLISRMPSSA